MGLRFLHMLPAASAAAILEGGFEVEEAGLIHEYEPISGRRANHDFVLLAVLVNRLGEARRALGPVQSRGAEVTVCVDARQGAPTGD